MRPEIITIENIDLDVKKVLNRLGYHPSRTQNKGMSTVLIDALVEESKEWIKPLAVFRTERITHCTGQDVCLGDEGLTIHSAQVTELLRDAYQASLFAVTIGEAFSERTKEFLEQNKITEAAILDAIGSEAVEAAAEWVNDFLKRKSITARATLTRRYSPGYGDWDVKEQKSLLEFISADTIGISLSQGGIMQPEKSISAITGWVKKV